MTDFLMLEKLQYIIKGMKKPRLLCRKGITTGGYFRPYMSLSEYTEASIFADIDIVTPVTVRFSSMLGDRGTADTIRNIKMMGIKFNCGNKAYDMICQSIPAMITSDDNKLIDVFNVFSKDEYFDGINKVMFWKYVSNEPEALLFAVLLYSHLGISRSFVDIKHISVNSAVWKNKYGDSYFVRYKWVPLVEDNKDIKPLTRNAAEFIAGYDPDIAYNEIMDRVRNKRFPTFELLIQIKRMRDDDNEGRSDLSLVWDDNEVPYLRAGLMIIDHLKDNEDEEDIWFSPLNIVEGISIYNDGLTEIMDYIIKTESMERGTYI